MPRVEPLSYQDLRCRPSWPSYRRTPVSSIGSSPKPPRGIISPTSPLRNPSYSGRIARTGYSLTALVLILLFAAAPASALDNPPHYRNPVYADDSPNPSVVCFGPEYWPPGTAPTVLVF